MILHEYLLHQRHEELLAEAERSRLIKEAMRCQDKRFGFYARILAWLGSILCNLGSLLERRYGEDVAISHSQSLDNSLEV